LGSFSDNPTRYHKEFLCYTWVYALTGVTFTTLLMTPSWRMKRREYGRQWNTLTNSMNNTPMDTPPATEAVPRNKPQWNYQDGDLESIFRDHYDFLPIRRHSHKQVNYDEITEVTQDPVRKPHPLSQLPYRGNDQIH
jgi:hypothetical protein